MLDRIRRDFLDYGFSAAIVKPFIGQELRELTKNYFLKVLMFFAKKEMLAADFRFNLLLFKSYANHFCLFSYV